MDITTHLRHIDSMTRYPQIDTYHTLDAATGALGDPVTEFGDQTVIGTEKIDGTNTRIIVFPDGDWIIGSRTQLLHARGDRIANSALGIFEAAAATAERIAADLAGTCACPQVFYLETYGHGLTSAAANYTSAKATGLRLFDIATLDEFEAMADWPLERVASWREAGGQTFVAEWLLKTLADQLELPLAPRLFELPADRLPRHVHDMHGFLTGYLPATRVALDGQPGPAEGIVLRTGDRAIIANARFQDYTRTLRIRAHGSGQHRKTQGDTHAAH